MKADSAAFTLVLPTAGLGWVSKAGPLGIGFCGSKEMHLETNSVKAGTWKPPFQ